MILDNKSRLELFKSINQRRGVRVSIMKLLFAHLFSLEDKSVIFRALDESLEDTGLGQKDIEIVGKITNDILAHIDEIDHFIKKHLKGWSFHRLAKVDLAILEVAIYELLYVDIIPHQVAINEALEISKEYSTEDASKFINGILGSIYRDIYEE